MIIIGEGGKGQASGRGRKETIVPPPTHTAHVASHESSVPLDAFVVPNVFTHSPNVPSSPCLITLQTWTFWQSCPCSCLGGNSARVCCEIHF